MFFYFARQSFEESFFFQLAFPGHDQMPAELLQLFFRIPVSVNIPFEFLLPKFRIRGWCRRLSASRMPMPETAPNLNNSPIFRKDNIRMPRQIFEMKTEAKSLFMEERAHNHFRPCIFTVDLAHIPTALFFR